MKSPTRASLGIVISAVALAASLRPPAAFAEEGHGRRPGRGSDDVVSTAAAQNAPQVDVRHDDGANHVNDQDVTDDYGVGAVTTSTTAAADGND